MKRRLFAIAAIAACAASLLAACASQRSARAWEPGESIICPRCGQGFTIPEKLGE